MVTCTRNRGDTKYLRVLACLIDPLRLPVWKKSKKLLDDNFAQATGRALCPQIADAEALLEFAHILEELLHLKLGLQLLCDTDYDFGNSAGIRDRAGCFRLAGFERFYLVKRMI